MEKTIQFDTVNEAEAFRSFCKMKDVKIANKSNEPLTSVTLFSPMTDNQFLILIYRFGRWM